MQMFSNNSQANESSVTILCFLYSRHWRLRAAGHRELALQWCRWAIHVCRGKWSEKAPLRADLGAEPSATGRAFSYLKPFCFLEPALHPAASLTHWPPAPSGLLILFMCMNIIFFKACFETPSFLNLDLWFYSFLGTTFLRIQRKMETLFPDKMNTLTKSYTFRGLKEPTEDFSWNYRGAWTPSWRPLPYLLFLPNFNHSYAPMALATPRTLRSASSA